MRKSRIILAIILLILLVGIGIVLPYIWKQNRQEPVPPAKTQQEQPSLEHTDTPELIFTDFEQMEQVLPKDVISVLKKLMPTYLAFAGIREEQTVTFLPEATTYPNTGSTALSFQLSDGSTLPVIYLSTGSFLFGEEKTELTSDNTIYEKKSDSDLPEITSEEIESRQEGGKPDPREVQP